MKISESLAKEIDKLTWKYVHSHMRSAYLFDSVEDFHSELLCFVLGEVNKFDSNRAKLSTFVYCCCWTKCALTFRKLKRRGMQKPISLNDLVEDYDSGDGKVERLDFVSDSKSSLDKDRIDKILFWNSIIPNVGDELMRSVEGHSIKELSKEFRVSHTVISRRLRSNRKKLRELRLKIETGLPTKNIIFNKHRGRPVNNRVKKLMSKFSLSERTAYKAIKKFNETGKCNSEEMKCILTED